VARNLRGVQAPARLADDFHDPVHGQAAALGGDQLPQRSPGKKGHHDGRRSWYKAGREFGRAIELGPVADGSYAFDCFQHRTVPESPEPVPATAWLFEEHLKEDARVWEESLYLPYYDAVLTLLLLRESVDDRELEEQPLAELDPTEFTLNRKHWPRR
jgi:hypothetical protein